MRKQNLGPVGLLLFLLEADLHRGTGGAAALLRRFSLDPPEVSVMLKEQSTVEQTSWTKQNQNRFITPELVYR